MWIKHNNLLINLDNVVSIQRWSTKIDLYVKLLEFGESGSVDPVRITLRFDSAEACDKAWEQILLITNPETTLQ